LEGKDGSKARPNSPDSPSVNIGEMVAKGVGKSVPFCSMTRMLPVFFSLKKMRPSGADFRESGKLRPVRIVVIGEAVEDWACGIIQEPVEIMINMTISAVIFSDGNPNTV